MSDFPTHLQQKTSSKIIIGKEVGILGKNHYLSGILDLLVNKCPMNYRILLVDDEPDILEFVGYNLRREEFEVQTASNGVEALAVAEKFVPHLVLLDVMMPEPLPADHPLWSCPNTILTPHVSGNLSLGLTCELDIDMFLADLQRYSEGKPPKNFVDRTKGY